MYDLKITDRAIESASRACGYLITRHSAAQISAARSLLDDMVDVERGGLKRALAPDEARFIDNERKLCGLDARYYMTRYAEIVNWEKEVALFSPNVSQLVMLDVWADLERQGRAIHVLQLKARRLGVSTLSELEVARRVQFNPYTNAVVASADPTKSVIMAEMIDFCWQRMPWWLLPKPTRYQNRMPVEFGEIHTGITIQAGNQFNGVARGSTPSAYHLSEIASWVDAEDLIDGALMRAIIDTPNVWGMMESTGEGRGNYLHNTWELLKQEWPAGRARQMPVFLPWYVGHDLYPSAADQRARPMPATWVPSDRTIRHAERAREYVTSNPLLFEHLAKRDRDWQMPREQMWFYEIEHESARKKKTLNIFLAEMASDDFDAFQSSNLPVIDQEILINYRERTRNPVGVYTIIGDSIPASLSVSRSQWLTGPNAPPPITIRVAQLLPRTPLVFQLVPVKFEGYAAFDPSLKLLIWEYPIEGAEYGVGVDTSAGIGEDNTAIEVLRKATFERPDAQVAEFVSQYIKAFQLWPIVLAIGTFYSVFSTKAQRRMQTRLAIECMSNGEVVQHEIQKRGWTNFHPWKRYDNRRPTPDAEVRKYGVYTSAWFRAEMMDMLLTCIDEEALDCPSHYLVQEFEALERDERAQKAKAGYGEHDDRVMAIGFPLFSLHVGDRPSQQYARRRVELLDGGDPPDMVEYPIWTPPQQALSTRPELTQLVTRTARGVPALQRAINRRMPRGYQ